MVILTPVYNDWESLGELLRELAEVKPEEATWEVYAVNDGSTDLPDRLNVPAGVSLQILHLSMNMGASAGHQHWIVLPDGISAGLG